MNPIYEWLYENYAKPRLSGVRLSSVYDAQRREWRDVAEQLSQRERLLAEDLMGTIRDDWGTLAFACGIRVGLCLAASPFERKGL